MLTPEQIEELYHRLGFTLLQLPLGAFGAGLASDIMSHTHKAFVPNNLNSVGNLHFLGDTAITIGTAVTGFSIGGAALSLIVNGTVNNLCTDAYRWAKRKLKCGEEVDATDVYARMERNYSRAFKDAFLNAAKAFPAAFVAFGGFTLANVAAQIAIDDYISNDAAATATQTMAFLILPSIATTIFKLWTLVPGINLPMAWDQAVAMAVSMLGFALGGEIAPGMAQSICGSSNPHRNDPSNANCKDTVASYTPGAISVLLTGIVSISLMLTVYGKKAAKNSSSSPSRSRGTTFHDVEDRTQAAGEQTPLVRPADINAEADAPVVAAPKAPGQAPQP